MRRRVMCLDPKVRNIKKDGYFCVRFSEYSGAWVWWDDRWESRRWNTDFQQATRYEEAGTDTEYDHFYVSALEVIHNHKMAYSHNTVPENLWKSSLSNQPLVLHQRAFSRIDYYWPCGKAPIRYLYCYRLADYLWTNASLVLAT